MSVACASWPHASDHSVTITTHRRATTINTGTKQTVSPSLFLVLGQANQARSASTAASPAAINPPHLCDSFYGLCLYVSSNPLLFAMQIGSPQALEEKRSRLVANAGALIGTTEGDEYKAHNAACGTCGDRLRQLEMENEALRAEVESLKRLQEGHDYVTEAGKMVKRLKKMLQKAETKPEEPVIACTKVEISSGTLVDETIINQLCRACDSGPRKFARALMRHVFSEEELWGKSLFGGKSCVRGETRQKEALDPVRVEAVIGPRSLDKKNKSGHILNRDSRNMTFHCYMYWRIREPEHSVEDTTKFVAEMLGVSESKVFIERREVKASHISCGKKKNIHHVMDLEAKFRLYASWSDHIQPIIIQLGEDDTEESYFVGELSGIEPARHIELDKAQQLLVN
ncbi:uncharacterized protein LOC142559409 [Dermacentor variabilis]|uniref:uncharacterized protein LOC142559409 n=1 Tax=Dermacentor variabilis TaxID=34621 RepID=UPI003F5C270D